MFSYLFLTIVWKSKSERKMCSEFQSINLLLQCEMKHFRTTGKRESVFISFPINFK